MGSKGTVTRGRSVGWGRSTGHTCAMCGAPIAQPSGKGRPREYCDEEASGRPCGRLARSVSLSQSLGYAIVDATPAEHRQAVSRRIGGRVADPGNSLRLFADQD